MGTCSEIQQKIESERVTRFAFKQRLPPLSARLCGTNTTCKIFPSLSLLHSRAKRVAKHVSHIALAKRTRGCTECNVIFFSLLPSGLLKFERHVRARRIFVDGELCLTVVGKLLKTLAHSAHFDVFVLNTIPIHAVKSYIDPI